jgi:hypothetical protein
MPILTDNQTPAWVHRMRERGRTVSEARAGAPPPVEPLMAPKPGRLARVRARIRSTIDALLVACLVES